MFFVIIISVPWAGNAPALTGQVLVFRCSNLRTFHGIRVCQQEQTLRQMITLSYPEAL